MRHIKLVNLYRQMSNLTQPKCATCKLQAKPHSCCNKVACAITLNHARDVWHIDLRHLFVEDNHVPFLIENSGCRVPPHLRPHCTKYTCAISAFGHDADMQWNIDYTKLLKEIETVEWEEFND